MHDPFLLRYINIIIRKYIRQQKNMRVIEREREREREMRHNVKAIDSITQDERLPNSIYPRLQSLLPRVCPIVAEQG